MAKIMTMAELRGVLGRGTRFCSNCLPLDNGWVADKKYWNICLARLPRSLDQGILPHPNFLTSESTPEHQRVFILDDQEARSYFEGISKLNHDPTVHHVTREMIFVRLDIAKFTKFPQELQPRILAELHETVHSELLSLAVWQGMTPKEPERILHIGDGFILAYAMPTGDTHPWPLQLAKRVADVLDFQNDNRIPIHFRVAVTCGPVYVTGDLGGSVNYVGDPITETERLIQCIPSNYDDVVCFSDAIYRKYRHSLKGMKFFRLGTASDKHSEMHRMYFLEFND